eukprot:631048-Prorocentrum_minimum.AAC.1
MSSLEGGGGGGASIVSPPQRRRRLYDGKNSRLCRRRFHSLAAHTAATQHSHAVSRTVIRTVTRSVTEEEKGTSRTGVVYRAQGPAHRWQLGGPASELAYE